MTPAESEQLQAEADAAMEDWDRLPDRLHRLSERLRRIEVGLSGDALLRSEDSLDVLTAAAELETLRHDVRTLRRKADAFDAIASGNVSVRLESVSETPYEDKWVVYIVSPPRNNCPSVLLNKVEAAMKAKETRL